MENRRRWHMFHGWCISLGIRPLTLPLPEFLDLIHFYRVERSEDPDAANALLLELTLPVEAEDYVDPVVKQVEEETGIPKPAFFSGKGISLDQLQAMRK